MNLQEATILALQGKLEEDVDKLTNKLDLIYNELYNKLKDIITKSYNDLIKLPIPKEDKTINMYYGSSPVYIELGNDLKLYDGEVETIHNIGLFTGGKYLIIYGLKVGGAYFSSEENYKNIKEPLENNLYKYVKPLVEQYNEIFYKLKDLLGEDIYSKYSELTLIQYTELRDGYYTFGVGEKISRF